MSNVNCPRCGQHKAVIRATGDIVCSDDDCRFSGGEKDVLALLDYWRGRAQEDQQECGCAETDRRTDELERRIDMVAEFATKFLTKIDEEDRQSRKDRDTKDLFEKSLDIMGEQGVSTVVTSHFLTQLFRRSSCLPMTKFTRILPHLVRLGLDRMGDNCMVRIGGAKVIFMVQSTSRKPQLILITCMPSHYKHNLFNKAVTIDMGTLEV